MPMFEIVDNLFLIKGSRYESNMYLIDGTLIVDTGLGFELKNQKENLENVEVVVNTHVHFDHTGGNDLFKDEDVEVLLHEKDAEMIKIFPEATYSHFFGFERGKIPHYTGFIKEGEKVKTENYTFEVIHTPGHTPGSICLYERKKKILISGDTVFVNAFGRTDLIGGNEEKLKESLKKLESLKIDYLLPGHGDLIVRGVVKKIK